MSVGKRTKSAGDLIILSPLYVYIYILFLNLILGLSLDVSMYQTVVLTVLWWNAAVMWPAPRWFFSPPLECSTITPQCVWLPLYVACDLKCSQIHIIYWYFMRSCTPGLCYKRQILSLSSGHAPFIHVLKSTYVACRPDAFTGLLLISSMLIIGFNPL